LPHAAVAAVGDDGGVAVGQQLRGAAGDVVGDEVERARQVLLGVVGLRERVDGDDGAGVEAGLELVASDGLGHVVPFG
jgi:hypothetical protein